MQIKRLGRKTKTSRGFEVVRFRDRNDAECSLQQSSLATPGKPETSGISAVWLGIDDPATKVLLATKFLLFTRMHLDRTQVVRLINHLQKWLDTGKL